MAIVNSPDKVNAAKRSFQRSIGKLGRFAQEIEEGKLFAKLSELGKLLGEGAESANLEPIFRIEKEVSTKVAKFQRTKSEQAVLHQFDLLTPKVNRYAPKMENGAQLQARMANAAGDIAIIGEIDNLDPFLVFFDEVWALVGSHEDAQVIAAVKSGNKGWQETRDGDPARYAEPYLATDLPLKVAAWLANKPMSKADHRKFKSWRQAGWDLAKGDLKHPFGLCPSCGSEPLLPYQPKGKTEWVPGKLGHNCYLAQKDAPASGKPVKAPKLETRAPEEIEADRVAARKLNEQNRLTKKERRHQNALNAKASRDAGDLEFQSGKRAKADGAGKKMKKQDAEARQQGDHPEAARAKTKKKGK